MDVFERVRSIQSQPIRLAREDPDLFAGLTPVALAEAQASLLVPRLRAEPGPWQPDRASLANGAGLLVMEGLILHRVAIGSHPRCALVGPGDLVRPWDEHGDAGSVALATSWECVEPATLAVLDAGFAERMSRWPPLCAAVVQRAQRHARSLSFQLALSEVRRVDERLLLLFRHLSDRWGRSCPEGIVIPVRLTHELLGQVIGAQRPTVSSGLQRLARAGLLHRRPDRAWVLRRVPLADPRPRHLAARAASASASAG